MTGTSRFHHRTAHEGQRGNRFRPKTLTLSLTLALDEVCGQSHPLASLSRKGTKYPIYSILGRPEGQP
jgi:hypothetical protein